MLSTVCVKLPFNWAIGLQQIVSKFCIQKTVMIMEDWEAGEKINDSHNIE